MARIRSVKPGFFASLDVATTYRKRAIPQATRRAVADRSADMDGQRGRAWCEYCGYEGTVYWPHRRDGKRGGWVCLQGLEWDHVVPEYLGGSQDPENVVLACCRCNRSKGHKTLEEWGGAA